MLLREQRLKVGQRAGTNDDGAGAALVVHEQLVYQVTSPWPAR